MKSDKKSRSSDSDSRKEEEHDEEPEIQEIPGMELDSKYTSKKPVIPENSNEVQKELEKAKKELEKLTETVIKNNQKAVADFKNDKKESLDFLIGQVQRLSKGKADPALVRQLLLDKLKS